MGEIEYAYAGHIVKYDKQPDGTLMVYGVATDTADDLDGQSCDPEWLKRAVPEWFKSAANVREQHSNIAAGKGKELTHADGDQWFLKSHIVDPGTCAKVINGVLTGYSVGIRGGRVVKGKAAGRSPNGVIVDGKIVEISLVDRPCNPNAKLTIVKSAAGGTLEMVDVAPLDVDIDPTMLAAEGLGAGHEPDDAPVAGDDEDDDPLRLFDLTFDEPGDGDDDEDDDAYEYADVVDKALDLIEVDAADDEPVTITKGLLEALIHGPKATRDADGDGKVGEGDEARKRAEARRKARAEREAERERERKHRGKMDAEKLRDAEHASRQGRRQEAGEHRGRLGSYDKAEISDGWDVLAALPDEMIVKAVRAAAAGEVLTAEELLEPTIRKAAAVSLDDSSADGVTLDAVTEMVKAATAEVTKAHEAELDRLRAQVDKVLAMPVVGGPVINKSVAMSAPVQPAVSPAFTAAHWEQLAAQPNLAPEVSAGYLAKAEEMRRRG